MNFRSLGRDLFQHTPLGYLPVRVRAGMAKGARWTIAPFSANWRLGGAEDDVAVSIRRLPKLEGMVCWDFGAHFGIHTVGLAMHVGPTGQVAAFEPDPVAFRRLAHHVKVNRLQNVVLVPMAASSASGQDKLYLSGGAGSTNSYLKFHDFLPEPEHTPFRLIDLVRPDDLVAKGTLRLPDFIKIDVQGHGGKAVAGSLASIRRNKPVISFSNHSWEEIQSIRDQLVPMGYRALHADGSVSEWRDDDDGLTLVCDP